MTLRIVHFTDIHITQDPRRVRWRALVGKRGVGWANLRFRGRSRAFAGAPEVVRAFVDDVRSIEPDHILFTGDVTGLSLPEEFRRAKDLLAPLLLDASRITGIPGNHDVYTRGAARQRLYEQHFGDVWSESDVEGPPPIVRRLSHDVLLVALIDARPCWLLDSSGKLGAAQIARLAEILADPANAAPCRIVALHYGPRRSDGSRDRRLHGLVDAEAFLRVVDHAGVDLVVHGHLHDRFILDRAPVPLTTPGSLTHAGHERAYHVLHAGAGGIEIEVRRYSPERGIFRDEERVLLPRART